MVDDYACLDSVKRFSKEFTFLSSSPAGCGQFFSIEILLAQRWSQRQANWPDEFRVWDLALQPNDSNIILTCWWTIIVSFVWERFGDWHINHWICANRTSVAIFRRFCIPFAQTHLFSKRRKKLLDFKILSYSVISILKQPLTVAGASAQAIPCSHNVRPKLRDPDWSRHQHTQLSLDPNPLQCYIVILNCKMRGITAQTSHIHSQFWYHSCTDHGNSSTSVTVPPKIFVCDPCWPQISRSGRRSILLPVMVVNSVVGQQACTLRMVPPHWLWRKYSRSPGLSRTVCSNLTRLVHCSSSTHEPGCWVGVVQAPPYGICLSKYIINHKSFFRSLSKNGKQINLDFLRATVTLISAVTANITTNTITIVKVTIRFVYRTKISIRSDELTTNTIRNVSIETVAESWSQSRS